MFSFRTTPLVAQLDRALREGPVACFCTSSCWRTDQNRYMWQIFEERGILSRVFSPREAELTPGTNHIEFSVEKLSGIKAIVVEIQDVGARYFNYTKDVFSLMEALNSMDEPPSMYVVDHINPSGRVVEGTMPTGDLLSEHTPKVAHRHGLSLGELCFLFFNEIGAKFPLHVISALATETNKELLPWAIPPCSDIPGMFTCELYAGGALWNHTNITPGIGTSRPYEYIGAPFIRHDGPVPPGAPGIMLRPCDFTPSAGLYESRRCFGYQLMLDSSLEYHGFIHTILLLRFFKEYYPEFKLQGSFRSVLADPLLMDFIEGKVNEDDMREHIKTQEQKWIRKARKFLLYEDSPYRIK